MFITLSSYVVYSGNFIPRDETRVLRILPESIAALTTEYLNDGAYEETRIILKSGQEFFVKESMDEVFEKIGDTLDKRDMRVSGKDPRMQN